jgi:hypothetical protein
MKLQDEQQRRLAQATLKEVMTKLEEALRLARELEEHKQNDRPHCGDRG